MPRIKIPESIGELFIIVDGGETFEGTLKQWENCFNIVYVTVIHSDIGSF